MSGKSDEGSSLVEVLVSLAVLSVTMAAVGSFFVNSFQAVGQARGRQEAAQLANSAIEQVRALRGSSLLTGRGQIKSTAQWNAAPSAVLPYLTSMQLVWDPLLTDPASTLGDDAAIPTASQSLMVNATTYTRTIFVGACNVYIGGSGACVVPITTSPLPADIKTLKFFRTVVLVTWPYRSCPSGTCTYVTSTLVSRAPEPVFDFHRPSPVVQSASVTLYKGVAANYQLIASGGQLPNTWTATPLPAGLTVTPSGIVNGTPTALGITATLATVTDTLGRSDTGTITFTVVNPPTLTVPAAQKSRIGDSVSLQAAASGGVSPFTYAATGLPDGLSIAASTGAITGTPTTAGTSTVTITATDANGGTATGTYTHTVYNTLSLASIADKSITLGQAFAATASASGGDGTYTYSATGLPVGVTIGGSSGAMSGTPTIPGRYLPTVTVADGSGGTASVSFALVVNTTLQLNFTNPSLAGPDQTSTVGSTVSLPIGTNASLLGLSPTYAITGLPTGLKYNNGQQTITGKPTAVGTYLVTITAVNTVPPQTSTLNLIWIVQ